MGIILLETRNSGGYTTLIKTHKIIQVAKSDKDYVVDSSTNLVIVDGLEMSLDRYQDENEFNSLNNSQKIYAILAASENLSKKQAKQKWEVLSAVLGIDESIAKKFVRIESGRLLER